MSDLIDGSESVNQEILANIFADRDVGIRGYCFDLDHPSVPQTIDIYLNGVWFLRTRCVELIDVRQIGEIPGQKNDARWRKNTLGKHVLAGAFAYEIPEYVPRHAPIKISVRHVDSDKLLFEDEGRFDAGAGTELASILRDRGYYRFSPIVMNDEFLEFSVVTADNTESDLLFNGSIISGTVERVAATLPSYMFLFSPDTKYVYLKSKLYLPGEGGGGDIRLAKDDQILGCFSDALFIPYDAVNEYKKWAFPLGAQIERVSGFSQSLPFFFDGYASYRVVDHILKSIVGCDIGSFKRVLDWGCGVGRLTQHLLRWTECEVLGADIDATAIEWCGANLPNGQFINAGFEPPLSIKDRSVDLIIGISVLTHLDEATQFLWLSELKRILSEDGVIIVTINSYISLYRYPHPWQEFSRLKANGIDAEKIGRRLDDILPDDKKTYYRETHHSAQYIYDRWSKWFDVVAILPGAHFCHQDYVVLRHRSSKTYGEEKIKLEIQNIDLFHQVERG